MGIYTEKTFVPMPRLKTLSLCSNNSYAAILEDSLSLETLICLDEYKHEGIKLPKLTNLIAHLSQCIEDIIKLNSDTLEFIALGVLNYMWLLDLPEANFPVLKQIVICDLCRYHEIEDENTKAVVKTGLQAKYPHVQITFEDCLIDKFAKDYLRSKGLVYKHIQE